MRFRSFVASTLVAVAALAATAPLAQAQGTSDTTVATNSGGLIEVQLGSGDVALVGWEGTGVRVRSPRGQANLDVRATNSVVSIRLDYRGGRQGSSRGGSGGSGRVRARGQGSNSDVEVSVPAGFRVVVHVGAGNVTARNVRAAIEAETGAGDISIENSSGRLRLSTFAGDANIRGVEGSVEAVLVSGRIIASDISGELRAETVSGSISLSDIRGSSVYASTMNGEVSFTGALARNGTYSFESFSGPVRLRIPGNSHAIFTIESVSGEVRTDIPMTVESRGSRGSESDNRRTFQLGDGGARVSMKTFNGLVVIQPSDRR